ncbi:hypothetical protein KP004_05260 [Geomonas oryzisoli]|uniref:Uncharacterized protein n=1 Tax=Geomonas oryzisoli TaxID=2847992 RepID=A0ABX8J819_9BACT|nr:hypothetical protein [Geomonas oryzisoli]QWV94594.1 hypothetical protein KP004_05260 [Geomonas oryzisoli]
MTKSPDETVLRNEDVVQVLVGIPEGHRHVRTTIRFADGRSVTFQEATVAAIVRAYITVKTDPVKDAVELTGRRVEDRKAGYAEWQLLEEPQPKE